ncbi:Crp/Fnr family transcriptional regulator [Vibrio metschnikovii]|uniref:Crp/Fnr family transcriptional regulator n=1 Tax=Vibrio metschnikovii TaxID=28172 RepID=UPI00315DE510|nr:Crp/Fnr family transcriptional regulator [Vibrio metschnikovii]
MKITPYSSGRFHAYLEEQKQAFKTFIYQCQMSTAYIDAGSDILKQGEPLEHIYVVPGGRVSMSILAANGRRFQLGEANCDYHIFGEMEFFTATPCQWTVTADEHLQVDIICLASLAKALEQHPEMMVYFAAALAEDYRDSMEIYTNRLLHPLTYNIAYDLLLRQRSTMALGNFSKASQEAERFGTSSRVYRRAVNELIAQGLVEKTATGLTIVDEQELQRFLNSNPQ